MSAPTLSVTVNNFNYGRFLAQNIESILSQSYDDFELILIDNASTDDSLDVMRRYAQADPRIRIVAHAENEGMFASLQESCELSRGRYRVPIEADDWILAPGAFQLQVDLLDRHPSMSFVYSRMTMLGSDGEVHHLGRPYNGDVVLSGAEAVERVLSFSLAHSGMMMRLDALRATPGYGQDYPHVVDMLLGVRLCEVGDVGYLDRSLYAFRQHDTNLHFRPQLEVVRRELLPVIDAAFDGPLGERLVDAPALRRRVVRGALVHLPTQYIFVGDLRTGWRLYWESCRVRPLDTVLQPRTLSLVSRSVLGDRGHRWLAGRLGRLRTTLSNRREEQPAADLRHVTTARGFSREHGSELPGGDDSMTQVGLRRGDVVEVRSAAEILQTLDGQGALDSLPFMPEMIPYCGRRFTVDRRADKVCDTINSNLQSRRLDATVFLDDLRCDGSGHGGCQAECRFYWKEAWLRRVEPDSTSTRSSNPDGAAALRARVEAHTTNSLEGSELRYRCQVTEMVAASIPLSTTDPRPYVQELRSGNVSTGTFVRVMSRAAVVQPLHRLNLLPMPPIKGTSAKSPQPPPLDLQPGEWVRVKSRAEIQQMLTDKGTNRGLWFDREMMAFCGQVLQVRGRVDRIIEEPTGKMIELTTDCIKLEKGWCSGEYSTGRWFCPREIYSYFRECWLERVDGPPPSATSC